MSYGQILGLGALVLYVGFVVVNIRAADADRKGSAERDLPFQMKSSAIIFLTLLGPITWLAAGFLILVQLWKNHRSGIKEYDDAWLVAFLYKWLYEKRQTTCP